jgi:hypothetical protein
MATGLLGKHWEGFAVEFNDATHGSVQSASDGRRLHITYHRQWSGNIPIWTTY